MGRNKFGPMRPFFKRFVKGLLKVVLRHLKGLLRDFKRPFKGLFSNIIVFEIIKCIYCRLAATCMFMKGGKLTNIISIIILRQASSYQKESSSYLNQVHGDDRGPIHCIKKTFKMPPLIAFKRPFKCLPNTFTRPPKGLLKNF